VVVEVLISSKNQVAEISGTRATAVPNIQARAMRLKDSEIIGQASSSDFSGRSRTPRNPLPLIEEMLTAAEPAK